MAKYDKPYDEALKIREEPPKGEKRLSKNRVLIGVVILALFFGFVLLDAMEVKEKPEHVYKQKHVEQLPGEAVRALPKTYSDIKIPEETRAQIESKFLSPNKSKEDEIVAAYRVFRVKNQKLARESELTFSGVKVPKVKTIEEKKNRSDIENPRSPYEIKEGTLIPAMLLTALNSDLPGEVLAQVSENVYDSATGQYLLIPQGAKLIGRYESKVAYGQERLLLIWNRIVFSDGRSINLKGMPGADSKGQSGLKDKVDNHYLRLFSGAILGSIIGAGAQVAEGNTTVLEPTFSQLAVKGAAKNINDVGQEITRKNLNVKPTITVRAGARLVVFVTRDLVLG